MNKLVCITIILNLYYSYVSSAKFLYTRIESRFKNGTGFGFGGSATGGELGDIVEVRTKEALIRALCYREDNGICVDSVPRVIVLKGSIDFRDDDGVMTETGCENDAIKTPECTPTNQFILERYHSCAGKAITQVSYNASGFAPLLIGSNKTLRGGKLIGKGLLIKSVSNVVITGVTITGINSNVAFGGSAFTVDGSTQVFIYNCTVTRTGIMLSSSGRGSSLTIAGSVFHGTDKYIPTCGDYHFFLWLVDSVDDQITFFKNRVDGAFGSGFSMTRWSNLILHIISNVFTNMTMESFAYSQGGALVLVEGNTFIQVEKAGLPFKGYIYEPRFPIDSKRCKTLIDRSCLLNDLTDAHCKEGCRTDIEVLAAFHRYHGLQIAGN